MKHGGRPVSKSSTHKQTDQYEGVTHIQCLPIITDTAMNMMGGEEVNVNVNVNPSSSSHSISSSSQSFETTTATSTASQSIVVTACSLGILRVWQFIPPVCVSHEGEGEEDEEGSLLVDVQATIKVKEVTFTSLILHFRYYPFSFPSSSPFSFSLTHSHSHSHSLSLSPSLILSQAHQGFPISHLKAEYCARRGRERERDENEDKNDNENENENDDVSSGQLDWLIASGDQRGCVVITYGKISPLINLSEHEESSRNEGPGFRGIARQYTNKAKRRSRSISLDRAKQLQRPLFSSVEVEPLTGEGTVTSLIFTKKRTPQFQGLGPGSRISSGSSQRHSGSMDWEYLAIGTSSGHVAVVDARTGQVSECERETDCGM